MRRDHARRGSILVAPLVGAALGLVVLAGLTASLAQAARWVVRADARADVHDTADLVAQTLAFDVRAAGWDPAGTGTARLVHAAPDALELHVDRDGDGVIDAASAERVRWRWTPARRTLSRLLGAQSMPLADTAVRAAFEYLDAAGASIPAPASGLTAPDLARVRLVTLSFALAPPHGGAAVERRTSVALRGEAP